MNVGVLDIEADALQAWDVTKILCVAIVPYEDTTPSGDPVLLVEPTKEELAEELLKYDMLVAHNGINYDFPVLRRFSGLKLTSLEETDVQICDTYLLSETVYPHMKEKDTQNGKAETLGRLVGRHSIESWGQRLGSPKGDYTGPWDVYSDDMGKYCVQDTVLAGNIYQICVGDEGYNQRFVDTQVKVWEIIQLQIQNGFHFDVEAAVDVLKSLYSKKNELLDELEKAFPPREIEMKTPAYWYVDSSPEIQFRTKTEAKKHGYAPKEIKKGPNRVKFVPFNPGSEVQIIERLQEAYSWSPTEFTDKGQAKASLDILSDLEYPEAKLICDYMLVDKRIGQIESGQQAWLGHVKEGKIHGQVNCLGTRTTRFTHFNPNLAQVPSVGHYFGKECRSLFKPREGWKLVGCDASGLEARMLAHYLYYWDDGEFRDIVLDGDVHQMNADVWSHCPNVNSRNDAKAPLYAILYGAGGPKVAKMLGVPEKQGYREIDNLLKAYKGFDKLVDTCKDRVKKNGYLLSLDGRRLVTSLPHAALNTLLQGGGAVVMNYALIRLYERLRDLEYKHGVDYAFCANVHDEWQLECREDIAEVVAREAVLAIRDTTDILNLNCPMDGEARIGDNWAETH